MNENIYEQSDTIHKLSVSMTHDLVTIMSKTESPNIKMLAIKGLKTKLAACLMDPNLNLLTGTYQSRMSDDILGYDTEAVAEFILQLNSLDEVTSHQLVSAVAV